VRGLRRALGWSALAVLGFLLAWKVTAEIIEPHFALWFAPRLPYLEAKTLRGTTLRLYADTRPHVGKIAGLQKGLIWLQDGRALVEEGYGFGCPIVESDGRAYVSRHAEIEMTTQGDVTRLIKRYDMDTVDTPIRFLRRKYRSVPSLGVVTVRYDVHSDGAVDVEVDLAAMRQTWSKAYLMNEQGAHFFTRYRDSDGRQLDADQLGIWQRASPPPERACFDGSKVPLVFCVEPEGSAALYYGRERYNQYNWRGIYYLAWSGVDIEIEGPRPVYRYRIFLEDR
jgi:hypothetical protein